MNERRAMYESYWAFEAGKWTKIDSVNRQAVPKIYDTFSKKIGSNIAWSMGQMGRYLEWVTWVVGGSVPHHYFISPAIHSKIDRSSQ